MTPRLATARRARGFTLLEVLIALAIVAMSVGALLGTITSSASNVAYLKDKTLAEWVALNRLTEIRIAQQMPDKGNRTGNTVMAGMRWQWEQEVTELPIKGMFRIDVRARPTGETVDDTREVAKSTTQKDPDSSAAGDELEKLSWTTTVTGIVGSAQSDRHDAIGAPLVGTIQNAGGQGGASNPGGANNPGGAPGGAPGSPAPGGGIISPKPPARDR